MTWAAVVVLPGCGLVWPDSEAWQAVLQAEAQTNFRDARLILAQIDVAAVVDPDLKEVIEYQKRLTEFCICAEINKNAGDELSAQLKSIQFSAVLRTCLRKGISNAAAEARRLMDEAAGLLLNWDRYRETRQLLVQRYEVGL